MPILYVHGVSVRDQSGFNAMEPFLRRLVAPAISDAPGDVWIQDANWYDFGVKFAWQGISRPRSRLLGLGAGALPSDQTRAELAVSLSEALKRIPQSADGPAKTASLTTGRAQEAPIRLRQLKPDDQSDLLAAIVKGRFAEEQEFAQISMMIDAILSSPEFQRQLMQQPTLETELALIGDEVRRQVAEEAVARLVAQGGGNWWSDVRDRVSESLRRAAAAPQYAASIALAEVRPRLNEMISLFIGDVFCYLNGRGNSALPGDIPQAFLAKLDEAWSNKKEKNGEPLVVISHSMGGQIVYDAVTHFLPSSGVRNEIVIDFWAAIASQVGFFEEAKLFLESKIDFKTDRPVPFPASNLKAWWNVWDQNDVLSFRARDIIANVDDEEYDSGMSLLSAHSGYFSRPSFYRRLAQKLRSALNRGL